CFDMHAMIIRSAMAQALAHCRKHGRGVASAIAAEPAEYAAHANAPEVPLSTICRAWASGIDRAMTPTPDRFQALRPVIEPVFYPLSDRSGFLEPLALHGLGQLLAPDMLKCRRFRGVVHSGGSQKSAGLAEASLPPHPKK